MAGDWIKMRVDLADDPAVIGIAAGTGLDEDTVVGKLHRLWAWADRQTTDGNAVSVSGNWIDRYLRAEGFAKAMVAVGWLQCNSDGITFPRFDRHNGQSAKRRALTANRVARHNSKNTNARANGDVTHTALAPLLFSNSSIESPLLRKALEKWVAYKAENGQRYKPRGLKALASRVKARADAHGEQAVIDAIERAMGNGWKGWDQDSSFEGKASAESRVATLADVERFDLTSGKTR